MFEIHGHRGARSLLPENTLSAFKYALDLKIDAIEVDIALTKDFVPVLHHDRNIKENANSHAGKLIRDLTLQQIKEIDVGSISNPDFPRQKPVPQERIPTLEEFLNQVLTHTSQKNSNPNFRVNLEIKTHPFLADETHEPEKFVEAIQNIILKCQFSPDRILFQSFDPRMLLALEESSIKAEKSFLFDSWSDDITEVARDLNCTALSPDWQLLSQERAKSILNAGIKLYTWTANTPVEWEKLVKWGVNGIITDDPKALLEWRNSLIHL